MAKTTVSKMEYHPPETVSSFAKKLFMYIDAIHYEMKVLNIKVKVQAVRALLTVFAFAEKGTRYVNAEMVHSLSLSTIDADYGKLHRLASKNLLEERHDIEPKCVFWELTQSAIHMLNTYVYGGVLDEKPAL
jgi:hypothetical protein